MRCSSFVFYRRHSIGSSAAPRHLLPPVFAVAKGGGGAGGVTGGRTAGVTVGRAAGVTVEWVGDNNPMRPLSRLVALLAFSLFLIFPLAAEDAPRTPGAVAMLVAAEEMEGT